MKLIQMWFSYRGDIRPLEFFLKGFAPGILLGTCAMILDDALNAEGKITFPFFAFSLWPASAMLWKLATSREQKKA